MSGRILCTFPGKFGDILWALPAVREISQVSGSPVSLAIAAPSASIAPLLSAQPYIDRVHVVGEWGMVYLDKGVAPPPAEWVERERRTSGYDQVFHLGYRDWPSFPLPLQTIVTAADQGAITHGYEIGMFRPWIERGDPDPVNDLGFELEPLVYLGWSDEWFELKLGLTHLLHHQCGVPVRMCVQRTTRWEAAARAVPDDDLDFQFFVSDWKQTAWHLSQCALYVGCLSAQWVLANALGIPCVVVEPAVERHNPIFWWDGPVEGDGLPRNTIVKGNDGKPTFDARHVVDAVSGALARKRWPGRK